MSQDMNFNFTAAHNAGLVTTVMPSETSAEGYDIFIRPPTYPHWRDATISNDRVLLSLKKGMTFCNAMEAWLINNNIPYELF